MKDIEQFLRDNKPQLPDEGAFLIETNARLSKVEGIKKTVDAEHRRYRRALIIAFSAGLAISCAVSLFATFYPVPSAIVDDLSALEKAASTLHEYRQYLLLPIAGCAVALAMLLMKKKQEAW